MYIVPDMVCDNKNNLATAARARRAARQIPLFANGTTQLYMGQFVRSAHKQNTLNFEQSTCLGCFAELLRAQAEFVPELLGTGDLYT